MLLGKKIGSVDNESVTESECGINKANKKGKSQQKDCDKKKHNLKYMCKPLTCYKNSEISFSKYLTSETSHAPIDRWKIQRKERKRVNVFMFDQKIKI